VNGPNPSKAASAIENIALFAMEILLEKEPWVNSMYTFQKYSNPYFIDSEFWPDEISETDFYNFGMDIGDDTNFTAYEGVYGNFAMGNITVSYNEETGNLSAYYGRNGIFTLTPFIFNGTEHVFFAKSQDPLWWSPRSRLYFKLNAEGTTDRLIFPYLLSSHPPVFVRDLKLSDAPPRPDGCT
jgi:hypothetical protein